MAPAVSPLFCPRAAGARPFTDAQGTPCSPGRYDHAGPQVPARSVLPGWWHGSDGGRGPRWPPARRGRRCVRVRRGRRPDGARRSADLRVRRHAARRQEAVGRPDDEGPDRRQRAPRVRGRRHPGAAHEADRARLGRRAAHPCRLAPLRCYGERVSLDALFAELVAHPADDGARLVWADAIGGARGELVALQSGLARGSERGACARLIGVGGDELTPAAVHLLGAARTLARVERLQLGGRIGVDAWCAVLRGTPRLRALDLGRAELAPELLAALPRSVIELRIRGLTSDKLAALADAPLASHGERLYLADGTLRESRPLARFTRLRALECDGIWFGGPEYSQAQADAVDQLIALELPALRELHLGMLSRASVTKLAQRFGPQLDLLDARDCQADLPLPAAVRELVAGELWHAGWSPPFPLFDAGVSDGPAW